MNAYRGITVVDEAENQDRTAPVILTTINCDGVYRYWTADNMNEWHEYWWCEDYDGPAGDDEVVELFVNGKKIPNMKTFEDIVSKYKFDLPYPT